VHLTTKALVLNIAKTISEKVSPITISMLHMKSITDTTGSNIAVIKPFSRHQRDVPNAKSNSYSIN